MKTSAALFAFILLTGFLFSFSKTPNSTVSYGKFVGDGYSAPQIILNADYTFRYIDKTDKNAPIDISGKWKIVEEEVILLDVNNKKVMNELEITREGKCLKARKGMAFYTLCNCE